MTRFLRWMPLVAVTCALGCAKDSSDDRGLSNAGNGFSGTGSGAGTNGGAAQGGAGGGAGESGAGGGSGNGERPKPNPDAFWKADPPPMMCLENGATGAPPDPPGGTPECPDDKNREGCACPEIGGKAACWPGLRVNRNHGICKDGMTECLASDEFGGFWGPCEGYVAPTPGTTTGPGACRCFSAGKWAIDNLNPCIVTDPGTMAGVAAVSTYIDGEGNAVCPTTVTNPPNPEPGSVWSTNRLTVDCAGQFELCLTLKAGDVMAPATDDCQMARVCIETWYMEAGVEQELPPLPAWSTSDAACVNSFNADGGYLEMSVKGLSAECDAIDNGEGEEYVFQRGGYCPASCAMTPDTPECMMCQMGGSGDF